MSALLMQLMLTSSLGMWSVADGPSTVDNTGALGLTIALPEDRWFRRDEDIPFRVIVANKTAEDLAVCFELSPFQKKVITFRLFDDSGREVTSEPNLHLDYEVNVVQDTVLLPPLGEHVGTLRLQREYLPRAGGCGTFTAVAVYHCPFNTEEVIGGRRIHTATGVLTSSPVAVRIDSRSWLKRAFGAECR